MPKAQTIGGRKIAAVTGTVNVEVMDRAIRRAALMDQFRDGEAERVLNFLDKELLPELLGRTRRAVQVADSSATNARKAASLTRRLKDTNDFARSTIREAGEQMRSRMSKFATSEANWQKAVIKSAVPVEIQLSGVDPKTLVSILDEPMQGATMRQWFETLSDGQQQRLNRAVQLGAAQGESVDEIMKRVRGTRALKFKDGAIQTTRREAQSIARTSVNHVSSQAREAALEADPELYRGMRWISTLDLRTSLICMGLDGTIFPIGKGQRPPAHFNCRSTVAPVLKSMEDLGLAGLIDDQDLSKTTRASMNGQVPASENYNQWLKRQPKEAQDSALGPARAKLFREGKDVSSFTSAKGKTITLDDLDVADRDLERSIRINTNAPELSEVSILVQRMEALVEDLKIAPTKSKADALKRELKKLDDGWVDFAKRRGFVTRTKSTVPSTVDAKRELELLLGRKNIVPKPKQVPKPTLTPAPKRVLVQPIRVDVPPESVPRFYYSEIFEPGFNKAEFNRKKQQWRDSLSELEEVAISEWTQGGYVEVRKHQQGFLSAEDAFTHNTALLTRALERSPATPTPLYRGYTLTPTDLEKLKKDNVLVMNAHTSFSRKESVGIHFARQEGTDNDFYHSVVLHVKNGHGIDVAPFSSHVGEEESIVMIGQRFRVLSRKKSKNGTHWQVELEEITFTEPVLARLESPQLNTRETAKNIRASKDWKGVKIALNKSSGLKNAKIELADIPLPHAKEIGLTLLKAQEEASLTIGRLQSVKAVRLPKGTLASIESTQEGWKLEIDSAMFQSTKKLEGILSAEFDAGNLAGKTVSYVVQREVGLTVARSSAGRNTFINAFKYVKDNKPSVNALSKSATTSLDASFAEAWGKLMTTPTDGWIQQSFTASNWMDDFAIALRSDLLSLDGGPEGKTIGLLPLGLQNYIRVHLQ